MDKKNRSLAALLPVLWRRLRARLVRLLAAPADGVAGVDGVDPTHEPDDYPHERLSSWG